MGPYGNFLGGLHFKFLEKYLLGHPNVDLCMYVCMYLCRYLCMYVLGCPKKYFFRNFLCSPLKKFPYGPIITPVKFYETTKISRGPQATQILPILT